MKAVLLFLAERARGHSTATDVRAIPLVDDDDEFSSSEDDDDELGGLVTQPSRSSRIRSSSVPPTTTLQPKMNRQVAYKCFLNYILSHNLYCIINTYRACLPR